MFDCRNPPFAITHISPEPIVENSFVNVSFGWAYKVVDFIVFPMGFTFDDDYIYVSFGKNDKDGWMVTLNKTGLLESMIPVRTKITGVSQYDHYNGTIYKDTFIGDANATVIQKYNRRGNSTNNFHHRGHHVGSHGNFLHHGGYHNASVDSHHAGHKGRFAPLQLTIK